MLINDILYSGDFNEYEIIHESCQQFIGESAGNPMVKLLPWGTDNIKKVKIRKRKNSTTFSNSFNEAFANEMYELRERSLFANGIDFLKDNNSQPKVEPFYVFPINGYDYIYSKETTDSYEKYSTAFDTILEELGGRSAEQIFADLLKFSYTSENLDEGLQSGAEIIMYGIPYYYAIKKSTVSNYQDILTNK